MGDIENLIEQEEYNQALKLIESRLQQDVYNVDLIQLQANVYHKLQEHQKAISLYDGLVNLMPNNAATYAARGIIYHLIGDHHKAMVDFTSAIGLEPTNGYRYASRAFIRDSQGDHAGALKDYNKAIELDPEDAVSLNNRGLIEEKLGKVHLAQEHFANADRISGLNPGTGAYETLKKSTQASGSKHPEPHLNLRNFIKTFISLFNSASERKKFIEFLSKKR